MAKKSGSVERVRSALAAAGVPGAVQELTVSTRSAQEAADAVGCDVAQIVKSLVLQGAESDRLFLVLTSGSNRVCVGRIADMAGEPVVMANAQTVRAQTGFAIGGVPPLGHLEPLTAFIDRDLLGHAMIWAAAGAPNALFPLSPSDLLRITGGSVADVAEQ
ncbi:MAG: YbaK/EbsC family protein [Geobacter sp.]|nr:YbaK/EbsC family protein [Geobacter sp.]